jgi:hypothetical protein
MLKGALVKSRSNVRQIVFPRLDSEYRVETADDNAGRGMTIHNLHCSEVSRWPRGGLETLASLRAAVVPEGEIVLESTPNGAAGVFYGEWQKANETGYTQHFYPWWYDESYREIVKKGKVLPLTPEESELASQYGLSEGQIAWRRRQWKTLLDLAAQEYAEDPGSCFLVSGECVFEVGAIERAAGLAGAATESEDNGRLTIWFPAERETIHFGSGFGRRRIGRGLRVRASNRADNGNAVRGIARALPAVRTGKASCGSGAEIRAGSSGSGAEQSWRGGAGSPELSAV